MESGCEDSVEVPQGPDGSAKVAAQIRQTTEELIDAVLADDSSLIGFERSLVSWISLLYRLAVALFLARRNETLDLSEWSDEWKVERRFKTRTIRTLYGAVTYGRAYLCRRKPQAGQSRSWFPLDALLGITQDGFSWRVIGLVTQLATRVSYKAARKIFKAFAGWAPSVESIESTVIGLGQRAEAFVEAHASFDDDGEILAIEMDGKAIPTATEEELDARRQKRRTKSDCGCGGRGRCQRHRGRKRDKRTHKKHRKKRKTRGHNSKNGKSATLIAMYTLRRGDDGKLHGPINKKVWGRFGSRHDAVKWARRQAERRGFGPGSGKRIQFIIDGEKCFRKRIEEEFPLEDFPNRVLTLDVRHAQERLWKVGRLFHEEGSEELAAFVQPLEKLLFGGRTKALLKRLRKIQAEIPKRGPNTKDKRDTLTKQIAYIEPRQEMMHYDDYKKEDLVLATGVIEGACRYVIGERLDCSGMRWIIEGAEPLLQLRCIELNDDWDAFIEWTAARCTAEQKQHNQIKVRHERPRSHSPPNTAASPSQAG